MSISTTALTNMLTEQITAQQGTIATLETQVASGQALNKPSDNPAAVIQVLSLSNGASQITSWQNNAQTASGWLNTVAGTLNNVINALQSANSLLLQASNQGSQDPTSYKSIGMQLEGIQNNLITLANTQYEGRSIFAGTAATPNAYNNSGAYLGNNDSPTTIVGPGSGSGHGVIMSLPGLQVFGSGSSSIFSVLSTVSAALTSGNPTSTQISTAINSLNNSFSTAEGASSLIGSASQEVSNMSSSLTQQLTAIQASQSQLQDINIPVATTQLKNEMANYQAALWAASRAIPETLQQFIAP